VRSYASQRQNHEEGDGGHDGDSRGSEESTFHRGFTLSITKALGDQLAADLAKLTRAP
jgi:hypothetical protein